MEIDLLLEQPIIGNTKARLEFFETQIRRAWVMEGIALRHIRDEGLWPDEYQYFEEYCQAVWGYHKSTVSTRINDAIAAVQVYEAAGNRIYTPTIYRELRRAKEADREAIMKRAVEIAITEDKPLTVAHIHAARMEFTPYPEQVYQAGQRAGIVTDNEKMAVLARWYEHGQDNPDSKFWSAYASSVIDPADGDEPVILANASVQELIAVEGRWQKSAIVAGSKNPPPIEGRCDRLELEIDGQRIVLSDIIGKKIRLTVRVME